MSRAGLTKLALLVLASWATAIGLLALALHFLAVTPGMLPDHLE